MRTTLALTVTIALISAAVDPALSEDATQARIGTLIAATRDSDAGVRRAAIRALAGIADAKVAPALLRLVDDPDQDIRELVTGALAGLKDRRCLDAFLTAARDPSRDVRAAAMRGLAGLGDPRAIPALIGAVRESDAEVAPLARSALIKLGDPAVDALAQALEGGPSVRSSAARALAEIGTPKAIEKLKAAAKHKDWFVRLDAVQAVGHYRPTVAGVLDAAVKDPNAAVRYAAAQVLANRADRDPGARRAMIPLLSDSYYHTRRLAAQRLARENDPRVRKHFMAMLSDPRSDLRYPAAENLARSDDPAALTALAAKHNDPSETVRRYAVEAMKKLRTPEAVRGLTEMTGDRSTEVARRAISALGDIKTPQAIDSLGQVLKTGSPQRKIWAADALGSTRNSKAVPHLASALEAAGSSLKRFLLTAIGNIGGKTAPAVIGKALKDGDRDVRFQAVELLGRCRDSEAAVKLLVSAVEDKDPQIGRQALVGLAVNQTDKAGPALLAAVKGGALTKGSWSSSQAHVVLTRVVRIGDPQSVALLAKALADSRDERLRMLAALAMGRIGDKRAVKPLAAAFKAQDHTTRAAAACALGQIQDPAAVAAVKTAAAGDASIFVRRWATVAWVRQEPKTTFKPFVEMLRGDASRVGSNARLADALEAAESRDVVEALINMLGHSNSNVPRTAARWLALVGGKRGSDLLQAKAKRVNANSRTAASVKYALNEMRQHQTQLYLPPLPMR